jgi:predicted metal-dependent hydrolase|tara:strand:+ start:30 stop:311 length:282 start_codon:yes stop_codon:yes gene_type:complete
MKVITINIDKESVLQEIQMLDGIQVKVPDTMSNEDVEKMLINNVPELHKYYYNIHEGEDFVETEPVDYLETETDVYEFGQHISNEDWGRSKDE